MANHTKGKWIVQGYRIYGPLDARSKHGNGRALLGGVVDDGIDWRAGPLDPGPDTRGKFHLETKANAALMAAAPDLLEACEALIAWADGDQADTDKRDHAIGCARAAVASAKVKP